MIITDEFINKIFPKGLGDTIDNCVIEKRKYLATKINQQIEGSCTGHSMYHMMVNAGLIVDGKKGKKTITIIGEYFLKQHDEMLKEEEYAKKTKPARIVFTYDEAMKAMFDGDAIYEQVDDDFQRIDSHEDLEVCNKDDLFYSCILSFEGFVKALEEDKNIAAWNPTDNKISTCDTCGYSWRTGLDSYHVCSENINKRYEKLKAAICIYAREEMDNHDFEGDDDVLEYLDKHAKEFNYQ